MNRSEDLEDIKRYFGVVAEGLRSDIRMVAESVATNAERIDRLSGELGDFRSEMSQFRDQAQSSFRELFRFRDEMYAFRDQMQGNFVELRAMIKLSYAE